MGGAFILSPDDFFHVDIDLAFILANDDSLFSLLVVRADETTPGVWQMLLLLINTEH